MTADHASQAEQMARSARQATRTVSVADTRQKNEALAAIASALGQEAEAIKAANARDLEAGRRAGLSAAMIDRLTLGDKQIESMAVSLGEIAALDDPVGQVIEQSDRPNGLHLSRVRVPIGVIFIIYESRPNVTVDAAALCLKSGNACILRGGSEALHSNLALYEVIRSGLASAGLPAETVQLVEITDHAFAGALLRQDRWIDVVIPRGGQGLIRAVVEQSTIPVIKHYKGVCHVYIDQSADQAMASEIALNAKCQRPGVCNAMETLLVHKALAGEFLAHLLGRMADAGVEIRGCERTCELFPKAKPASEADWGEEYLDLILAVRVVDTIEDAIDHIARYGSAHTDAIVTGDAERAGQFVRNVDSSSVMVNASTRFSDGGQYGLGAEVGISTDKLHARGPMGVRDLTTYKYVVRGDGQVRT
ncbi:MAG: glutamate-5-semialdehyde dehydrogenase [Anaerolineaceae bacterium]|nr:glutamate-5-semialdehyde dehydrogenase [Anaerolineaceae bacterium]